MMKDAHGSLQQDRLPTGRVRRQEWGWVLAASTGILVLGSLPYATGHLAESSEWVFSGAVFDRMDFSHHLGGIWLGLRGEWAFQLLNTAEPHPGLYFRLFYLVLGHLARALHLAPLQAFHLSRVTLGLALLAAVYRLAGHCFPAISLRRTAFLLFALGSGLGWLQLLTGAIPQPDLWPLDFWHIDGYGFFTLLTFPHLVAVSLLLTISLPAGMRWLEEGHSRHGLLACGALLMLQAIQPFSPAIAASTLLLWALANWSAARSRPWVSLTRFAALNLPLVPYLAYQAGSLLGDDVWRSFVEQNVTLSPPPLYYLLGYGILTPLVVWGGWMAIRRKAGAHLRLAVAWLAACFLLAYLPISIQRRFTLSAMIPIALLATSGLAHGLLPWIRHRIRSGLRWRERTVWPRLRRQGMALVVAMASISSLYLSLGTTLLVSGRSPALFDPGPVVQAVNWLAENSDWRSPVLGAERTGRLLVERIGHRVYLGHPVETAHYARRSGEVAAFFGGEASDDWRVELLRICDCRYVFHGPYEQALGNWDPSGANFLEPVFHQDAVTVFRVLP